MGTSMSSKGPRGKNPLVPPWAEEGDSLTIVGGGEDGEDVSVSNPEVQGDISVPLNAEPPPSRFQAARKAFGEYAKSGTRQDLKKSLGHYARVSTGKGSGAAKRLTSGITAGSALFGLLNGHTVTSDSDGLRLTELSGLTSDQAIDKIVTHLTPVSGDSNLVRTAMNFALSEVLEDFNYIDDVEFTPEVIGEVFTCYITDLVFQQVVIDMGKAWFHAETALRQITMENELRELIKVIVDQRIESITGGDASFITQNQITQIQITAIDETITEWEMY